MNKVFRIVTDVEELCVMECTLDREGGRHLGHWELYKSGNMQGRPKNLKLRESEFPVFRLVDNNMFTDKLHDPLWNQDYFMESGGLRIRPKTGSG
ncbi:hypothetical protein RCL_jg3691.t1 [Rhizophagus clarus]|uniref:Uncharacterized protein n=1 Tax=Rhizophagus clarus TaxID=94130 RepID=A0A8H3M7K2_9GLOM|nr:hypothetical protein RCL_jg3691.t1 [Rhizophagus clarus]